MPAINVLRHMFHGGFAPSGCARDPSAGFSHGTKEAFHSSLVLDPVGWQQKIPRLRQVLVKNSSILSKNMLDPEHAMVQVAALIVGRLICSHLIVVSDILA